MIHDWASVQADLNVHLQRVSLAGLPTSAALAALRAEGLPDDAVLGRLAGQFKAMADEITQHVALSGFGRARI